MESVRFLTGSWIPQFCIKSKWKVCVSYRVRGSLKFGVSFVLALNRVNILAVTTILVLHVGVNGHYVHRQSGIMFPRRSPNIEPDNSFLVSPEAGPFFIFVRNHKIKF